MLTKIFLSITILIFSPLAIAEKICDGSVTSELEACAKDNFSSADKALNEQYKKLTTSLPAAQRSRLLDAQRDWIKYKDTYCQAAFNATSPGDEAAIDKWSCLDNVTRARTRELNYIESASGVEDFYHAIAFMAKTYESGNKQKVIEKLSTMPNGDDDRAWIGYVQKNCQLTADRLHEDRKVCIARQNFYRDWFE